MITLSGSVAYVHYCTRAVAHTWESVHNKYGLALLAHTKWPGTKNRCRRIIFRFPRKIFSILFKGDGLKKKTHKNFIVVYILHTRVLERFSNYKTLKVPVGRI